MNDEHAQPEQLWDPSAELAVLGGMFIDADAAVRMLDEITEADFHRQAHRKLFAAMVRLIERGEVIDGVTLQADLQAREELAEAGGLELIGSLYDAVPTAANIAYHAQIVRDHAHRRALKRTLEVALSTVLRPEGLPVAEVQERVEKAVMDVGDGLRTTNGLVWVKTILWPEFDAIEKAQNGEAPAERFGTGLHDVDWKLNGGAERGDMVLVAGRPSMGKSSLAVGNIAAHLVIEKKRRVAFFTLETKKEKLLRRLLQSEARVNMQRAFKANGLRDDEYARLATAAGYLNTAPLFIDDTAGATASYMRASLRRMVSDGGPLDAVVVDYLGKMRPSGGVERTRNEIVGEISAELKDIAMDFNCVMFALSQLSRAVEARPDKRPMMSDLRDSGSLEQDADLILFLFRPEYYFGPTDKGGNSLEGKAEVMIGKCRDGETGSVQVVYEKEFTRFANAYPRIAGATA
jgi:replicative DNA helicase